MCPRICYLLRFLERVISMPSIKGLLTQFRKLKANKVSVGLPFGLGSFEITPNKVEQRAAWALYVELTTRIAVQPFNVETGSMRSALESLYTVFTLTRQILRDAGPDVAESQSSFGPLAIEILTQGIAPFTAKWHHRLQAHESLRSSGMSALEHERSWEHFDLMLKELEKMQREMRRYTDILAEIAGAKGMGKHSQDVSQNSPGYSL